MLMLCNNRNLIYSKLDVIIIKKSESGFQISIKIQSEKAFRQFCGDYFKVNNVSITPLSNMQTRLNN